MRLLHDDGDDLEVSRRRCRVHRRKQSDDDGVSEVGGEDEGGDDEEYEDHAV